MLEGFHTATRRERWALPSPAMVLRKRSRGASSEEHSRRKASGYNGRRLGPSVAGFPSSSASLLSLHRRRVFSLSEMGNSSSGVSRTSEVDKLGRAEDAAVAGVSPSISSASCVSSMEKTVLLHDWWLIKVRDEGDRERLAVGGLTAFGKAARIFNSAPVAKRYDAYTLETTDGITVRIQGLINVARMNHNGFPSEACNHFRIGFPYNWKDYADKYFGVNAKGSDSTKAAVNEDCYRDSANSVSCDIPNSLTQYPTRKIIDCLNAICKDIIASEQGRKDAERYMEANDCTSKNTNGAVPPNDGNIQGKATHDAKYNVCNNTPPHNDAPQLRSPVESSKQSICNGSMKSILGFSASLAKVGVHGAEEKARNAPRHVSDAPVVTSPMGRSKQSDCSTSKRSGFNACSSTDTFTSLQNNTKGNMGCRSTIPAADPRFTFFSNATLPVTDCPDVNSPVDWSKPSSSSFSMKSNLHCATSSVKDMGPKKESISTVVLGLAIGKQRIKPYSVSNGALKDAKGNMGSRNAISSPDTGTKCLLNRSLPLSGGESKREVPGEVQLKKGTHLGVYSPQGTSIPESNAEAEQAPGIQLQKELVKFPRYDETQISTRTENPLKKSSTESSSLPVAQSCVSMNRHHVESGGSHGQDGASVGFAGTLSKEADEPAERSNEASRNMLGNERYCLAGKMCLVTPMTTVTRKSPRKQLSFVDKVVFEKAFLSFDAERRETPSLSKSDTGRASSASEPEAHQSQEDVDLNLVFPSRISFGFEGFSPEPSNNEAADLPPKSSGEVKGSDNLGTDEAVAGDNGPPLMADRTRSNKSIRGSPSLGSDGAESQSGDPDVASVRGNKVTRSSTRRRLCMIPEDISMPSLENGVKTLQESSPRTRRRNARNDRKEKASVSSLAKNDVFSFTENDDFDFSENDASYSNHLTKCGSKAAAPEQSASGTRGSHVSGLVRDAHRSDAPVDLQPSKKKPSLRTPKSVEKAHSASKTIKSPQLRQKTSKLSFASPERLNLKRSKSGRILVPKLSNWYQQILYEDGLVAGILTGVDASNAGHPGSRSEPPRKRKKFI